MWEEMKEALLVMLHATLWVVGSLVLIVACVLVVLAVYDGVFDGNEQIVLDANEFTCTRSHEETLLVSVWVGKSVTLVPQTNTMCDQYTRRH